MECTRNFGKQTDEENKLQAQVLKGKQKQQLQRKGKCIKKTFCS